MVASLDGIIFHQFYGDNSGGAEFDTDGDGTTTQEDEFVSVQNTSGVAVDLSGWQIWSDMSGAGAPDGPQDGLYHTFPPGTVLSPGKTLHIVNEYTGTPPSNIQEASEGGLESGSGGTNTNFLSEGDTGFPESVALVNPSTGEYIILNLSGPDPSGIPSLPGFPGTASVGESNAATDSGVEDQNAGSSYTYNSATDSYDYQAVMIMCFATGTMIAVPGGEQPVENLRVGDLVVTKDHGNQPIRYLAVTEVCGPQIAENHLPILIAAGSLGPGTPRRDLVVSAQHRMLLGWPEVEGLHDRAEVLSPSKGLVHLPGVRIMRGVRRVRYVHLLLDRHEVLLAEGAATESFYPGPTVLRRMRSADRQALLQAVPELRKGVKAVLGEPARQVLSVQETEKLVRRCKKRLKREVAQREVEMEMDRSEVDRLSDEMDRRANCVPTAASAFSVH